MTFRTEKEAFVWIWLPDETEPLVAGCLETYNDIIMFNYGSMEELIASAERIDKAHTSEAYQKNRRIEIKLTSQ